MNRLLCIIALSLCGCAHISGERKPDGTMTVRTTRFMWSTQNLEFSVNDGTNVVATLRAKKSSPDAEALGAIAEGVARGLKP